MKICCCFFPQSVEEGEASGSSPEQSASTPNSSRPTSARRLHRHGSSGNQMLDQLLKDLGNKLTVAEDVRTSVIYGSCSWLV